MKMYIIRHGQTPWNARKCLQGRSDVDLNENGIYLAELTGKALRDVTFDMAFTSPLIRAKHTAQCILAGREVPIIEDERLIEDILVYGEDDTICAEVYPNFKYAEAANIADIESTVTQIIKKHNEELPTFKRILRSSIREVPFAKTSSKKIIRSQYFSQKKQEAEEQVNVHKPENDIQQKIYDAV